MTGQTRTNSHQLSSKYEPVQSRWELAVKRERELQLSSSFDRVLTYVFPQSHWHMPFHKRIEDCEQSPPVDTHPACSTMIKHKIRSCLFTWYCTCDSYWPRAVSFCRRKTCEKCNSKKHEWQKSTQNIRRSNTQTKLRHAFIWVLACANQLIWPWAKGLELATE